MATTQAKSGEREVITMIDWNWDIRKGPTHDRCAYDTSRCCLQGLGNLYQILIAQFRYLATHTTYFANTLPRLDQLSFEGSVFLKEI